MGIGGTTRAPAGARSTRTWAPPVKVTDAIRRVQALDAKIKQHKVNAKVAANANDLKDFNFSEVNRDLYEFKSILEYLEQADADNQSSMYANRYIKFLSKAANVTLAFLAGIGAYATYQEFISSSTSDMPSLGNSTQTGCSSTDSTSFYVELMTIIGAGGGVFANVIFRGRHVKVRQALENQPLTPSQNVENIRLGYKCMKHCVNSSRPKPTSILQETQNSFGTPQTDLEAQQISSPDFGELYSHKYRKTPNALKSCYLINPRYLSKSPGFGSAPAPNAYDDDSDHALSEVYPLADQSQNADDRDSIDE